MHSNSESCSRTVLQQNLREKKIKYGKFLGESNSPNENIDDEYCMPVSPICQWNAPDTPVILPP